jgi:hypothetical protein
MSNEPFDELKIKSAADFKKRLDEYPATVKNKMIFLRNLIIEVAKEAEDLNQIEETLKWGEPSFITKHGSTLRMDWKEKTPDQYALYFKCTSKLIETFKNVFGEKLKYEGNRAIVFDLNQEIPVDEIKSCIKAALLYHKVKKHPNLGITET